MKKMQETTMVVGNDYDSFSKKINNFLAEGWELYLNHQTVVITGALVLSQMMVRYKKEIE